MEIQNISEVHGEATITLTEKELFMIEAALESKEKIYGGKEMYHKLCAQLITAKSICEYGRIDHSYFQAIIKHMELSKQNC